MLVRAGVDDDFPAMASVFSRASLTNEGDRNLLSAHRELTELDPPGADDIVLVAEVAGHVVGFVRATARGDDALEVIDLFVDPDHMRLGIGGGLINAVAEEASVMGRDRIEVDANRHAVAFYGRVGFLPVREVQLKFGTALRMVRRIDVP